MSGVMIHTWKGGGSRRHKGYLGVMTYRLEFWFACAGSDESCILSGAVKEVMKPFLERLLIHQPLCRLLSFSPVFYHEQWHPASFKFLEVGRLPQFCALLLLFMKVFGVQHAGEYSWRGETGWFCLRLVQCGQFAVGEVVNWLRKTMGLLPLCFVRSLNARGSTLLCAEQMFSAEL